MKIGIPKEIKNNENRVGMTPAGVAEFIRHGHEVMVQHTAGENSGFADEAYEKVGAIILPDIQSVYREAEMIVKVKEPIAEEYPLIHQDQLVFTYFHFACDKELTDAMLKSGAVCLAYETVETDNHHLPLLIPMSEVAGRMAIINGAFYLQKTKGGKGKLMSGVPGVNRVKVLVLGGGTVGEAAARMAAGMGADVWITDISLPRLRQLEMELPINVHTLYSNEHNIRRELTDVDIVVGIVDYRDHQSFVMADIPGIIEGASEGKGLGLRFLRHIERNSLLLFMVPGDTDDIKKEYEVLLGELKNFNPEMLDKHRVLAITKCDLLDEELIEMLKETLPTDLPVVFISSVTGQGIQELKDVLWKELNSESNKLQEITAEDTLVHRDKDMSRFQQELAAEGEDVVEYIDEDEIEDVDDLDDFEYE